MAMAPGVRLQTERMPDMGRRRFVFSAISVSTRVESKPQPSGTENSS
jgi:hypothetical protein